MNSDPPPSLELTIDFKNLELGAFAKFFLGFRSLALRALIITLQRDQNRRDSLRILGRSYLSFLMVDARYRAWIPTAPTLVDGRSSDALAFAPEDAFGLPVAAEIFDDWADKTLSTHDVVLESVSSGSLVAYLCMAGLLQLAEIPYQYSVLKDVVKLILDQLGDAVDGKNSVSTSLNHVPESVIALARHRRVKEIKYSWDGTTSTLVVKKY